MTDRRVPHVAMLLRNPFTHDSRVQKEAATLRDAGYAVTVVADAGPDLPEREQRDGISVIRIPRSLQGLPGVRYALHDRRLANVLVALRPSLLHAHDSNALLAIAMAARRLRRPFVYDAHELWLHRPRRGHPSLYHEGSRAYYSGIQRWLVPRASAVLTVSAPIKQHLERVYRGVSVGLVPNYPTLTTRPEPAALRQLIGDRLPGDAPIVLHLGGLMATRGLEQLVMAMPDVLDAHLVFVGGGDIDPLQRLAEQLGVGHRIHSTPPVPPSEVEAYAAAADIGVLSTLPIGLNNRYSLANKLFQYMAAGIPVVASDFPQIREVVVGSDAGLVVDPRRPSEIAAVLNALLADPQRRHDMGERGRRAVEARYNWSVSASALLAAYDRIGTGKA